MEIDIKDALAIVLDLAEQNMIDRNEVDMSEEWLKQDAAIEAVRIHYEAM